MLKKVNFSEENCLQHTCVIIAILISVEYATNYFHVSTTFSPFHRPDFKQHTLPCDMTAETLLIGNLSVRNGDELTRGGSIASSSTSSNSTRSKGSKHRPNVLTSGKNRVGGLWF